jgi:hypothetical protein
VKKKMNWENTQNNDGVNLTIGGGNEVSFVIPSGDGHVNAIQANLKKKLIVGQKITLTYKLTTLSGHPRFNPLGESDQPANFSLMIAPNPDTGRWYVAGTSYVVLDDALDKGEQTWFVKLKPQFWQDVNGQQNAMAFKRAVPGCRIIQVVFGGQFRAHGIREQGHGTARFELKKFVVS